MVGFLWKRTVFKVDSETGDVLDSVSVPCPLTTSLSFGGENMDELFVTAAYLNRGPTRGKITRLVVTCIELLPLMSLLRLTSKEPQCIDQCSESVEHRLSPPSLSLLSLKTTFLQLLKC